MIAKLTEHYLVYLASRDVDVVIPATTEFELLVKHRDEYIGIYTHPQFGEITVTTKYAERVLGDEPTHVIEQTPDYTLLDWGVDGQAIHCMHCAYISYDEADIEGRYCPVCKTRYVRY
jgi:hypothetical protein